MTTLITITSVPADKLADNQLQVVARWKDTDKRPIAAANRVRAVILPATIWTSNSDVTTITNGSFRLFLLDAIAELAKDYLSYIVEASNWQRTQVNEDAFSISSLLSWQQEQAALSGRLNGEEISKWAKGSATVTAVATTHGAAIGDALAAQLVRLASPNHGLTPEKAGKILATLWKPEDADNNTGLRVQLRLTAIRDKSSEASANVLDSIL